MKTPIQELIDDLTRRGVFLNPSRTTLMIKWYIDYWHEKEKEFAKQCFEAGRKLEDSEWMDTLGALPEKQLDFDNFYKQFEQ